MKPTHRQIENNEKKKSNKTRVVASKNYLVLNIGLKILFDSRLNG